ncbi:MAG: SDR family oxidoreductase [Planctomycetota bacterium]
MTESGRDAGAPVVLVTGASGTLGGAIARRFGRGGGRVLAHYCGRRDEAERLVVEIARTGGDALAAAADFRERKAPGKLVTAAVTRWGRLDHVIHAAGNTVTRPILKMSGAEWDDVIAVNLTSAFRLAGAAEQHMKEGGAFTFFSSLIGLRGQPGEAAYAAAKGALGGLARSLACELGPRGIRVNLILPGFHDSALTADVPRDIREWVRGENVLGRVSTPEEVAEFVFTLAQRQDISGQVFNLDSRILSS